MSEIASLRRRLLWWLLPGTLLILVTSLGIAWWIARDVAADTYDQGLIDAAREVAAQLGSTPAAALRDLPSRAQRALLVNPADRVYFRIEVETLGTVAGDAGVPFPAVLPNAGATTLYNAAIGGASLRAVALATETQGRPTIVLIASTLAARDKLIQEVLLGLLVPEVALILAAIAVVWFGTGAGLAPLAGLRRELASRSATDLRPLTAKGPLEIQPVVREINHLLQRLEKALDAQRHFVSDAAHQLRTPIAALQAQLEAGLRESEDSGRQQLEKVLRPAHRLSHLVDQLLALARAEPSRQQAAARVQLPDICRDAAERWLPGAIARHIDLGFDLQPATVQGNALLLSELLANLIDNALRHTPEGGVVTVSCGATANEAWLTVEDSGPGIAEAEREKVFDRFYQSPGSGSDGCGLGLAIVAEIARQHDGTASAGRSAALGGALLKVSLPSCGGSGL